MDNTWASPLYFRAFDKGVDLSIQAATKYVGGLSVVQDRAGRHEVTVQRRFQLRIVGRIALRQVGCRARDGEPFFGMITSRGISHALTQRGVEEQALDGARQALDVARLYQQAIAFRHHHFRNASDFGGHHRSFTSHRFQVDDAEGLVHGGADENGSVRIQGEIGRAHV